MDIDFNESAIQQMSKELTLKIIIQNPFPGVIYGLQKGKGSNYETVQKQTASSEDLTFEFDVQVKQNDNGEVVFLGPYTHGSVEDRFVYIDIGTYAGQTNTQWSRRLKIPLSGINKDLLNSGHGLVTEVPGIGKDGGPNCATVKPFMGWQIETTE